jgi:hypothetical protein
MFPAKKTKKFLPPDAEVSAAEMVLWDDLERPDKSSALLSFAAAMPPDHKKPCIRTCGQEEI